MQAAVACELTQRLAAMLHLAGTGGTDAASVPFADRLRTCREVLLPRLRAAGSPATPSTGPEPQLQVRRARALAERRCANLRCTNLAGASEAEVKGRKCAGCITVRYCCEACNRQDWRQHRAACRLLRAGD
jgi:hypothetical protein